MKKILLILCVAALMCMTTLASADVTTFEPIANFTANTTSGTAPLTVQFTDMSTNATSWAWDFDNDGLIDSSEQNPVHTYSEVGTYSVNLTVTNAAGNDSEVKTDYITIEATGANGLADTAWPKFQGNLQNTGQSPYIGPQTSNLVWTYLTGNYVSYFGSATIGPDGTIYVGSRDAKLYALNPNGTLKWSYTTGDKIYGSPAIGSDGTIYAGSLDYNIYALNPNGTLKWSYATGGKIYSSPTIGSDGTIYVGSYDYNLYALNPNGTLKWNYTTENCIPGSPAIASDGTIYIGSWDDNLYAINEDGTLKWKHALGTDIHSSPAIGSDGTIYIGGQNQNIYALYSNGTLKWSYKTDYVIEGSPAIASDGTIYIGSWDTNLYALNANGTLKWKYATGDKIYFGSPAIGADGTVYIGSGDSYIYALSSDGTLKWRYPTGKGIYGSLAIGADGTLYGGSSDRNLYAFRDEESPVEEAPVADFTADPTYGNAPLTVSFTDNSTNSPMSWAWDFGDYSNSTEQNPTHTYSAAGNYTVNLTVVNSAGTDFEVKTDYITVLEPSTPEPVAMFIADATSGTVPLTVNFTDQSTGSPTSWSWDFGNGANSTEQNPVHTYSVAGNYTVNLKVTNAGGSDEELKTDYITVLESSTPEPEPVAAFTADVTNGTAPLTVNFTDQSTGSPTSWLWDFGDESNSTEQNPVHTYASAGSYTVNLTVENSAGTDIELKTDYIEVSEASGSTVTLYFDPESSSVSENESTEISIVASLFPEGLSGYNLTVAIDNPTVAEIVDIEYPTWALITENSSLPGTSIYLKTVDGEDAVKSSSADVVLATLTVSGKESGSANLSIGVKRLEDDSGDTIEATLLTGKIEVALLSPLPDQEYAPRDLDGDGIYEDLTGNGEFSFVDIVAYFHNMDWIEENMPVEYFDFNGNGRIDFDDVVDMFGMI